MFASSVALSNHDPLLSERIGKLITALSENVYERDDCIRLGLLATLSGESLFLFGPPGIAKSLIATRLSSVFRKARSFHYLMTRFSTPEEVFGPLSIHELKDNGQYIRLTKGYLPESDVVFLDEIWKAGSAILNTLLTIINERIFRNGQHTQSVPTRVFVAASNELPDPESGLNALYDRFLVRIFMHRIKEKTAFKSMMLSTELTEDFSINSSLQVSDQEYQFWLTRIDSILVPSDIFELIYLFKLQIETHHDIETILSDRRWKKALHFLQSSAFFNGRDSVHQIDLLLLSYCLWDTPQDHEVVNTLMLKFCMNELFLQQDLMETIKSHKEKLKQLQKERIQLLNIQLKKLPQLLSHQKQHVKEMDKYWIKLITLQSNPSVNDQDISETRYIYIDIRELKKKIKSGHFDIHGFINESRILCNFTLEVDGVNRLVIRDTHNRTVPLACEYQLNETLKTLKSHQDNWRQFYNDWKSIQHSVSVSLAQFRMATPHHFASFSLINKIDNSLFEIKEIIKKSENEMDTQNQWSLLLMTNFQLLDN